MGDDGRAPRLAREGEGEGEGEEHEAVDWMAVANTVAESLVEIGPRLGAAITCVEVVRTALDDAAGLLLEATDAAETLFADALALVPSGSSAPLMEGTVDSVTRLVARVFPSPLSRAVDAAAVLVANVSDTPLLRPLREVELVVGTHIERGHRFAGCGPLLGVEPGDAQWRRWRRHHVDAMSEGKEAHLRLRAAAVEAEEAAQSFQSPLRGDRVSEAEEIVREVIDEVDLALEALRGMHRAVADELLGVWAIMDRHA